MRGRSKKAGHGKRGAIVLLKVQINASLSTAGTGLAFVNECVAISRNLIEFAFITRKSSLEPLLEGLFAQIHVNHNNIIYLCDLPRAYARDTNEYSCEPLHPPAFARSKFLHALYAVGEVRVLVLVDIGPGIGVLPCNFRHAYPAQTFPRSLLIVATPQKKTDLFVKTTRPISVEPYRPLTTIWL